MKGRMTGQIGMFDGAQRFRIDKPVRLIEFFAGYGSQYLAIKRLGIPCESWCISEWAIPSIQAYKDLHCDNIDVDYSCGMSHDELVDFFCQHNISADYDKPITKEQLRRRKDLRRIYNNAKASNNLLSIVNVRGGDLRITERDKYCYIMTYSFPCQ